MCMKSSFEVVVTVIVPTYRRLESLERALKTLLSQSHQKLEIIVIDDNANECWNKKVQEIIHELKFSCKVKYVQNKVNIGSAKSRNLGIDFAMGEYITFLDDDDIYLKNKIENQLNHMLEKGSDFSITDLYLFNKKEELVDKRERKYIVHTDQNNLMRYHLKYHMTGTDTLMFKREYLINIGGFPEIDIGDEYYLVEKAIKAGGKFSYLEKCDVKAYIHQGTESLSSGKKKIEGEKKLYNHKKKYFAELSQQDINYIKMRHYAVLAYTGIRQRKIFLFLMYSIKSFLKSPGEAFKIFYEIIRKQ